MSFIKTIIKEISVFLFPVFIWKNFVTSQHNNEESSYLIWLCQEINAHKSFIEFGFGPFQFNSVSLAKNSYNGLLLDGSEKSCRYANYIFNSSKLKCNAITHWIALDTLDPIKNFLRT